MASTEDKIKVLYIGGFGRSGSTLLLRALGQIDGFFPVGEMWNIWKNSFGDDELCGCGRPFSECDFWNAVVHEAFGGSHQVNATEMIELKKSLYNNWHLPMLVSPYLQTARFQKGLETYLDTLNKLYRAIQRVSGSRVIIDSSKGPRYMYLLNQNPDIEVYALHLVRDSRAAAYSWQKKKIRPEVYWKETYLEQPSLARSALLWDLVNVSFHLFKHVDINYLMVPYEDLISSPRTWFSRIVEFLGEHEAGTPFFHNGCAIHLGMNHTVAGNPNRFQQGLVEFRLDSEWQRNMTRASKYFVTALTLPLLYSYGYLAGDYGSPETISENTQPRQDRKPDTRTW
jgi:hypothetical protein